MSTGTVVKLWVKVVSLMGVTGMLLVTPMPTRLAISPVLGQAETELMLSQDSRINGVLDSTNETLEDGSYFHRHQFQGEAGEEIAIELTSDEFDSYLILLDPEENKIAENNDSEASHAKIVITLPVTGTYTVIVTSYQPEESGDYRLRWRTASTEEIKLVEASQLNQQVMVLYEQGKYNEAIPLAERALAIRQQILGQEHLDVATSLNNLVQLYVGQGRYREAEPLSQQAVDMFKKLLGDESLDLATSLNNLAFLYESQGRYSEAEPLYQQAVDMFKKLLGDENLNVAPSLNNLASLYESQGRYSEAEPLYQQVLQMRKKLLGDENLDVATSLNNLAFLYQSQRRYAEAEPLYQQALDMFKKLLGDENLDVATSLNNLASLYQIQRRYSEAEFLSQQALQMRKKLLVDEHPDVAASLNNLASLYQIQGKYEQAKHLYQQALDMFKKLLDDEHPSVATSLNNLAILYWTQDNTIDALNLLAEGLEVEEKGLERNLIAGSDQDKQKYIATISKTTDMAISLHLNKLPNNKQAARLALTTILRRKGRILDFFANNQQLLRRNLDSESQTLLDELSTTRSQLANLIYHQPPNLSAQDYRNQLSNLSKKADNLENRLYRRSQEFRQATQPITIEAIQKLIPKNAALVELVQYKAYNPKEDSWGKPRYAAYILPAQGEPQAVDLGEVEQIESTLYPFHLFLQDANAPIEQLKQTARLVEQQLMQPVRERLGSTKTILFSPDGSLNLIPFEALVDEQNRYLVENYSFTYLTSGRDLLRLVTTSETPDPPVIMGAPLFDTPGEIPGHKQHSDNSLSSRAIRGLNPAEWGLPHLPGTAEEVKAIASLFNVEPFLGKQATEGMIKQVNHPYVLHIATHGFFETVLKDSASKEILSENPLLLSGLVLAGVKLGQSGGEDGVLTALEATGLDLWGTQLVVLSACDTGNGDITTGEGIYGLRRAFVIAGAESQLISLWKVNDLATKDLMIEYYQRLKNNPEGRSIALQQIKRQMLQNQKYQHPYYWASFIFSGNWRPMEFPGASH